MQAGDRNYVKDGVIVVIALLALVVIASRFRGHEALAPAPAVVADGPEILPRTWFRFDEPSGLVIDSGTTGRPGRAFGVERFVPGVAGKAARFPASEQRAVYVRVDDPVSMANWTRLTVTAWVLLEDHGGFNLVGRYGGPGADPFIFGMMNRRLDVTLGYYPSCEGMTTWSDGSGTELPVGVWTHVAFTLDLEAHRIEFFVNGKKTFTDRVYDNNVGFCERGSPLLVGPFLNVGAHPYSAMIDEVKLFDAVLGDEQIRALSQ